MPDVEILENSYMQEVIKKYDVIETYLNYVEKQ